MLSWPNAAPAPHFGGCAGYLRFMKKIKDHLVHTT
jgi:hypothetical protein